MYIAQIIRLLISAVKSMHLLLQKMDRATFFTSASGHPAALPFHLFCRGKKEEKTIGSGSQ
jgi:hypothetical protein